MAKIKSKNYGPFLSINMTAVSEGGSLETGFISIILSEGVNLRTKATVSLEKRRYIDSICTFGPGPFTESWLVIFGLYTIMFCWIMNYYEKDDDEFLVKIGKK